MAWQTAPSEPLAREVPAEVGFRDCSGWLERITGKGGDCNEEEISVGSSHSARESNCQRERGNKSARKRKRTASDVGGRRKKQAKKQLNQHSEASNRDDHEWRPSVEQVRQEQLWHCREVMQRKREHYRRRVVWAKEYLAHANAHPTSNR